VINSIKCWCWLEIDILVNFQLLFFYSNTILNSIFKKLYNMRILNIFLCSFLFIKNYFFWILKSVYICHKTNSFIENWAWLTHVNFQPFQNWQLILAEEKIYSNSIWILFKVFLKYIWIRTYSKYFNTHLFEYVFRIQNKSILCKTGNRP